MDKESTDSAVHLSDIENIANGLEKLVTSWEIEGAHRSVKYSSLHTDQLYNDEHKRKTGQMQLSIQSSQAMPSINSSGLQKSVIKGRFQYNPSTSFSQVRWKAELEGCNQLSFKLKDHQSNSSAEDSREIQQDLNVQLEDNASSTSRMSTVSNDNNYCQSGSQALNKLENQENYQIYKEAKAQDCDPVDRFQEGRALLSSSPQFQSQEIQQYIFHDPDGLTEDDGSNIEQSQTFQETEDLLRAYDSNIQYPPTFHQQFQYDNFQEKEGLFQADDSISEDSHTLHRQVHKHHSQEPEELIQADELNPEELQIDILERTINSELEGENDIHKLSCTANNCYEVGLNIRVIICVHASEDSTNAPGTPSAATLSLCTAISGMQYISIMYMNPLIWLHSEYKIIENKMKVVQRKSHQEQLHAEKEQSMLTPKTKDAKSEKVEQTFMREEIRLDNCRKRIHKLEMERDALVKERLNYIKRERQFESQKKILADAMRKVNSLQRKLSKKEEENIECLLREKEIKAQLYEIQVSLQESRAASSGSETKPQEIPGEKLQFGSSSILSLTCSQLSWFNTSTRINSLSMDYFRGAQPVQEDLHRLVSETHNLHLAFPLQDGFH
eukprot:Gb_25101 [translate_table: standard]